MKIIDKTKKGVITFDKLNRGDVFKTLGSDHIYMKTTCDNICDNAICLIDGVLCDCGYHLQVIPLQCELIITG